MSEQMTSAAVNLQLPQLALTAQVKKKYAKWFRSAFSSSSNYLLQQVIVLDRLATCVEIDLQASCAYCL